MKPQESQNKHIPCFLCGNGLPIQLSKKSKPYFICDPCGLQTFVRRDKGIKLLETMTKSLEGGIVNCSEGQGRALELIALTNRLFQLKAKRAELNNSGWNSFFRDDEELHVAVQALEKEIKRINKQLNEISK